RGLLYILFVSFFLVSCVSKKAWITTVNSLTTCVQKSDMLERNLTIARDSIKLIQEQKTLLEAENERFRRDMGAEIRKKEEELAIKEKLIGNLHAYTAASQDNMNLLRATLAD